MTRFGWLALPFGAAVLALGIVAHWRPVAVLGGGVVVLVLGSLGYVSYRPRLELTRAVEPPRVEKGQPAVALIEVTNLSRRSLAPITIDQRLGDEPIRSRLPRMHPGQLAIRTYRLPTSVRGTYEIGPVEMPRADSFGFCRTVRKMGDPQEISVHPRLFELRTLPTGVSRNLEGPTSDAAPQGSVTFHRLREYVVGDDLRTVHWLSTARQGKLVVRHNVDTAQPYTVVLFDLDARRYTADSFEEAVDVAASVAVSSSAGRAPVQLRTTSGNRIGGPAYRDPTPIIDLLTDVQMSDHGLEEQLVLLRRDRGGTALVVVTGAIDQATLPGITTMRRRFDRVIVLSLVEVTRHAPSHPGLTIVEAPSAAEMALRWNTLVAR